MSDIAVVVPGIMGSNLYVKGRFLDEKLWLISPHILGDSIPKLALADDGLSMRDGSGRLIYAASLFAYYYTGLTTRLRREGFEALTFPYDWRKSVVAAGNDLADSLAQLAPNNVYLVCHSMGGLVAVFAEIRLRQMGQAGHVKRILTLGTPFGGSFAIPRLWGGLDPTYDLIARFTGLFDGLRAFTGRKQLLDFAIASWPGVYQLMPFLGADTGSGPVPELLYDPATYRPRNPWLSARWIANAANIQGTIAGHTFDPSLWVAGVATGTATAGQFIAPFNPGDPASYAYDPNGDGVVPAWSAIAGPPAGVFYSGVTHAALAYDGLVLESVGGLLRNGGGKALLLQRAA